MDSLDIFSFNLASYVIYMLAKIGNHVFFSFLPLFVLLDMNIQLNLMQ